ncbi:unnamed protein product, partial [Ixodes hexagonus]
MLPWMPRVPLWQPVLWALLAVLPPCAGDCNPDDLEDRTLNQMPEYTTKQSFPDGAVHGYRCMNGYRPSNERRSATCRGTTWELDTAHPLNCHGISCGAPEQKNNIEHGTFRSHIFSFPHKVQFNCERGYRLHSHSNQPVDADYAIYCRSDGTWTEPLPKCLAVVCPRQLAPVGNGQVDTSAGFGFQAVVHYSCHHGYRLVGPSSRTCQEDGTWSGPQPVCEGE